MTHQEVKYIYLRSVHKSRQEWKTTANENWRYPTHNPQAHIERLRDDLVDNPDAWENNTLESYLEALAAFVRDAEGYYQNRDAPMPNAETWRTIAEVLTAAKMYE